MERNIYKIGKELFITNDEEIKEGNYFLYDGTEIRYKSNGTEYHGRDLCHISGNRRYPISKSKKIILTTDQSLDGVQDIDDKFLEWFIKNPSCEFVKVNVFPKFNLNDKGNYGIIIPKEELERGITITHIGKQETLEEAALRLYPKIITDPYNPFEDLLEEERDIFVNGAKWQQEDILELLKVNGYEDEPIFDLITEQFKKK